MVRDGPATFGTSLAPSSLMEARHHEPPGRTSRAPSVGTRVRTALAASPQPRARADLLRRGVLPWGAPPRHYCPAPSTWFSTAADRLAIRPADTMLPWSTLVRSVVNIRHPPPSLPRCVVPSPHDVSP